MSVTDFIPHEGAPSPVTRRRRTPTKFELTINLQTGKALGHCHSAQLLTTADQVIE
jgi:hypothetical protein